MVDIPFAEWFPDRAPLGTPVSVATNVIPWADGYKSFPSLSTYSTNSLAATYQGGWYGRDNISNVYIFAGDISKLYHLNNGAFEDVSRTSGGAYATAYDDWWEMIQWGETIIAVNGTTDVPQVFALSPSTTNFTALGGSPPKARHIAIVREFVVLGNINDGTAYPARVRWSGINNSASWAVSETTQADYQDLQGDGGWIQKVIGGETGYVFQERAIWRMTYIGSPVIFQFDLIEKNRGAFAPQSVVGWGNMIFYLADDGFYQITGGATSVPIGDGKIDKFFLDNFLSGNAHRITGTVDPINKVVLWSFPSNNSGGVPDFILIYNWVYKKWSLVEQDMEGFIRFASASYTLDNLDTLSSSIDAMTTTLDSRAYTGGAQILSGFNTSHALGTFTGSAMSATVDTGEIELTRGGRSSVQELRPLVDGNAASVTIGTRNTMAESVSFGSAISQNASGFCPARTNANFHRFRVTTSGDFDFIQGLKVKHVSVGNGR